MRNLKLLKRIIWGMTFPFLFFVATAFAAPFIRGDADEDGSLGLADAVLIINYIFGGKANIPNLDAADVNDSGALDLSDAVFLLSYIFGRGQEPPAPFPIARCDPTPDEIGLPCDQEVYELSAPCLLNGDPSHPSVSDLIRTGAMNFTTRVEGAKTIKTYTLLKDINAPGTAFVFVGSDLALDLNGHTVTYNNANFCEAKNWNFKDGLAGWTTTGTVEMGALVGIRVRENSSIASEPMTINAGKTYSVFIAFLDTQYTGRLSILDASNGAEVAGVDIGPSWHGELKYKPESARTVKIKFACITNRGKDVNGNIVILDGIPVRHFDIKPLRDYGIVLPVHYDHPFLPDIPASHLRPLGLAEITNVTITDSSGKKGIIRQGQGYGRLCHTIFMLGGSRVRISNVELQPKGPDSCGIEASYPGQIQISYCKISSQVLTITNRHDPGCSGISFGSPTSQVEIDHNEILNSPQWGILLTANSITPDEEYRRTHEFLIHDNFIRSSAQITNAYAIAALLPFAQVYNNRIGSSEADPSISEGIQVSSYPGISVHDNYIYVYTRPNPEFPSKRSFGINLRWAGCKSPEVYNNTVVSLGGSITDEKGNTWIANASAFCLYSVPKDCNAKIYNNTFRAKRYDAKAKAVAFEIYYAPDGANVYAENNVFESNHHLFATAESGGHSTTLVGNTFRFLNQDYVADQKTIYFPIGDSSYATKHYFADNIFEPLANLNDATTWKKSYRPEQINFYAAHKITVSVKDASGNTVPGARVWVEGQPGGVFDTITNQEGKAQLVLSQYRYDFRPDTFLINTEVDTSRHTIKVEKDGLTQETAIICDMAKIVEIVLAGPIAETPLIVDHNAVLEFDQIPSFWIEEAIRKFKVSYAHTSHGSQIITGMKLVKDGPPYDANYRMLNFHDDYHQGALPAGALSFWDLDGNVKLPDGSDDPRYRMDPATPKARDLQTWDNGWAQATRNHLTGFGAGRNVILWSWCTDLWDRDKTAGLKTNYLDKMSKLEEDFPSVNFIYMTGALKDDGNNTYVHINNNAIRDYCKQIHPVTGKRRILFDFADIESWDLTQSPPVYKSNESDACQWARDWEARARYNPSDPRSCPIVTTAYGSGRSTNCRKGGATSIYWSSHTHGVNSLNKAKAFWWMLARLAGWPGVER